MTSNELALLNAAIHAALVLLSQAVESASELNDPDYRVDVEDLQAGRDALRKRKVLAPEHYGLPKGATYDDLMRKLGQTGAD